MPQNIFGTDGVRGVANADLSCDLAFRLGRAATKFLGPDICIGRDTRLSGTMLESALTAGIMAEGGTSLLRRYPHACRGAAHCSKRARRRHRHLCFAQSAGVQRYQVL